MDYEKVHEAAITLGRKVIEKNPELKDWAFKIMPELRTTEEQDLIDKIINLIQEVQTDEDWHVGKWSDDAIEWLRAKRELIGQHTEHKFKIGDYVVGKFLRGRVIAITSDAYLLDTEMGFPFTEEDNVHLWSLDDIHPGDTVTDGCGITILFKRWFDYYRGEAVAYAGIDTGETLQLTEDNDAHWTLKGVIRPATNEEIDKLNSLLSNAGYGWNSMTKEIFKIGNLGSEMISAEESLGISSEDFNEIVDQCIYGDDDDPCESCKHPKLNCHNFPCWKKQNYIKNNNGKTQPIWTKETVISALTEELSKRIKPLHEKSLKEELNEREHGYEGALIELRSYINSPEFNIGAETEQTVWTAHDDTMFIYARKYLDDILHQTPSEEQQQEIIDAMNWLSGIKAANKKTGNINVDEMVAERSRKRTMTYSEKEFYRQGIKDTLNKLNEK